MKYLKVVEGADSMSRVKIEARLDKFKLYLTERGGQVMLVTNEWEVVRFLTDKGTGIIYSNKKGNITFYGTAWDAWDAYLGAKTWRAFPATRRSTNSVVNAIRARDGDNCFYCLELVTIDDESEEHLLSLTHMGPDTLHNKVLAHRQCNNNAGSLPLFTKIKLHVAAQTNKLKNK